MTKKKRELIEILLDNITPDDWPKNFPFATQDIKSMNVDHPIYAYRRKPVNNSAFPERWNQSGYSTSVKIGATPKELCKRWRKTIVTRDEFVKRWNERNPVVDSEGWIKWNGGEMPVEHGTLIDVKYRNGVVNLHVKAGENQSCGSIPNRCAIDFKHDGDPGDIIAYRLHTPRQQKTPQQLALEKFGTDWHENDGAQPVSDEVLIDAIVDGVIDHGVKMERYTWNTLGLFEIKKWRIHRTTAPAPQEAHTEETKPIQQENIDAYEWPKKLKPSCSPMDRLLNELEKQSATDTQIGGNHYTKLAIQPMRYSMKNGLDPLQHTIIKYVTRFRDKNGIEDLEKAKHCIDMLIEHEKESK